MKQIISRCFMFLQKLLFIGQMIHIVQIQLRVLQITFLVMLMVLKIVRFISESSRNTTINQAIQQYQSRLDTRFILELKICHCRAIRSLVPSPLASFTLCLWPIQLYSRLNCPILIACTLEYMCIIFVILFLQDT